MAGPDKPNILFILSDQHRFDALSCRGNPHVKTPHLDRFAAESADFRHAVVQCPLCVPSRRAILSGRYPIQTGVYANNHVLSDDFAGWTELLHDAHYHLTSVGRMHGGNRSMHFTHVPRGRSFPGSIPFMGNRVVGESEASLHDFLDMRIGRAACDILENLATRRQPWVMYLGFHAPHPPYVAAREALDEVPIENITIPAVSAQDFAQRPKHIKQRWEEEFSFIPLAHQKKMNRGYYALVNILDRAVGNILQKLASLGLAEDTLVIYTSDHGEGLGEHGQYGKHWSLYDGEVRVPFLMRWPGRINPGSVWFPLELVDIFPTFCNLAGVPCPDDLPGIDIFRQLQDPASRRDYAYSVIRGGQDEFFGQMLRSRTWKYCTYASGEEELYNLAEDAKEMRNLAADPGHRCLCEELRTRIGTMNQKLGGIASPATDSSVQNLDVLSSNVLDADKVYQVSYTLDQVDTSKISWVAGGKNDPGRGT